MKYLIDRKTNSCAMSVSLNGIENYEEVSKKEYEEFLEQLQISMLEKNKSDKKVKANAKSKLVKSLSKLIDLDAKTIQLAID